jgi:tRNA U55 pseudouridine synthase TruB
MGSVGHITQLQRQSIGPFTIKESLRLDEIEESKIQPFSG